MSARSTISRGGMAFAAVAALACASARADTALNKLGFDMTWHDEFAGTNVNAAKWNVEDYGTPANNELQYYTPDMVYVENDVLVIQSDRNDNPGEYSGREFVSGKLTSAGRYAQQYGYWEIRGWLPEGNGLWPAHWMLGYNGWPPEIDVTEMIGNVPNHMVMSVHWGPVYGDQKPWEIGQTGGGDYWHWESMCWSYHVFALEWNWWGVKFYIDGVERASCYHGCPHEPMFFILNTAVGGDWPGYPWGTAFPKYHIVDYVRIWQYSTGRELLNRGFEEGDDDYRLPDWNTYDNGNIRRDSLQVNAHSGGGAMQIYGRFTGGTNASGLYQDLFAFPGEMLEGSFWIRHRLDDALQSNNTVQMKIEFLDESLGLLTQRVFTVADAGGPATYRKIALREVAPANTVRARLVLELIQRDDAPGALSADDADFTFVTPFTYRPLLNEGFEMVYSNEFANWRTDGGIAAETLPTNVRAGVSALRMYEEPSGTAAVHLVRQDLPARAGEDWTASTWAGNRSGEPLTGTSIGFLRLEFVDAAGGVLASSQVTAVTAASPAEYTNVVLQAQAPAQTAWARILLGLEQDGSGGGSVVFDSAGLAPLETNATPQLINGDFELFDGTNYSSWTWYSAETWNTRNETNAANARGGTNAVWLFGQFPGGGWDNVSGLYQDLSAAQGQVWEASVWAQNRPNDGLQNSNRGRLKIEFLDVSRTRIDYDQFSPITSGSPSYYQQVVIRRVAPTNTAYARIVCEMKQIGNADGSVNFDDAELRLLTVQDDRTLANGSFEVGEEEKFLNWSEWGNVLPNIVHEDQATNILDESQAVKLFGQFPGDAAYNECGLFQDVPVAPGEMWLASVWAKNRHGDALAGANAARLKLEYLTSSDEAIGTNAMTIIDAASSDDEWAYFAIRHLIPDGASRARIVLQMNQVSNAAGAVNFDRAAMRLITATDAERSILQGGFEQGVRDEFGSWDRYGAPDSTNVLRDPVAANARSGQAALQMRGSYDGATNHSGLFQSIPAREGELWQGGVWARNRPGDPLTGRNLGTLKLEFINEWGSIIQVDSQDILDAGSSTNYQEFILRGRAPWGSRLARIVVQLDQYDYASGSINIDDAQLGVLTAEAGADLANGDLEDFTGPDFLNWSTYGDSIGNVIRDPQTNAFSGAGALQIWGEYTSWQTFSGLYQGVPASEGQLWKASCRARNRPGDALQGNNQARLKFDFADSSGAIIRTHVMPVVTAASSTNYVRHALIAPAPAGCSEVRVVLELMQENWQGGSANFDDAALEVIPELVGTQDVQRAMLAGPLHPGRMDTLRFTGDLVLDASVFLNMEIGGTNNHPRMDRLDVAGTCTLNGTLDVSMVDARPPYIPRKGENLEIIRAAQIGSAFQTVYGPAGEGGGHAFTVQTTATNVSLQAAKELDTDGDGLPDYWEQEHFGSALGAGTVLDADGDRIDNLGEYISDTVPTNRDSVFHLESLSGGPRVLQWSSSSGRLYSIYFSTNLLSPAWGTLVTNLPATPTLNVYTDSANEAGLLLYRIVVGRE